MKGIKILNYCSESSLGRDQTQMRCRAVYRWPIVIIQWVFFLLCFYSRYHLDFWYPIFLQMHICFRNTAHELHIKNVLDSMSQLLQKNSRFSFEHLDLTRLLEKGNFRIPLARSWLFKIVFISLVCSFSWFMQTRYLLFLHQYYVPQYIFGPSVRLLYIWQFDTSKSRPYPNSLSKIIRNQKVS